MRSIAAWLSSRSTQAIAIAATSGVILIGLLDYLSGSEISWSIIYIFPIALATWYAGPALAYGLAILSVASWLVGDYATGGTYTSWFVPIWNSTIRLAFYYAFVGMLFYIRTLTGDLEARVIARTADLERLEREMVEVGERERRRIGADLHDGLGQHLTGTSLAAQVLRKQLLRKGYIESEQAAKLIELIEQSIAVSHRLAKGLQPVELHSGGLMQALQEFSATSSELLRIPCSFRCDAPVLISDVAVSEQLYRIAQEATSNAVRHGRATKVMLSLEVDDDGVVLRIADDGSGFAPNINVTGMGLKIMAKRASLIGARFDVQSSVGNGTTVTCHLRNLPVRDAFNA